MRRRVLFPRTRGNPWRDAELTGRIISGPNERRDVFTASARSRNAVYAPLDAGRFDGVWSQQTTRACYEGVLYASKAWENNNNNKKTHENSSRRGWWAGKYLFAWLCKAILDRNLDSASNIRRLESVQQFRAGLGAACILLLVAVSFHLGVAVAVKLASSRRLVRRARSPAGIYAQLRRENLRSFSHGVPFSVVIDAASSLPIQQGRLTRNMASSR